ncbi:sigma 54-interacting transcriptional regulator [Taurinivorans muris]|uniref:Sigma 54-interacting transcriptional regulator n=1 Tax=Taurinivorans muris TaxID=2787751 RepID=A0ABY5Y122_9BACT|nr:sigma 54-interacting transcriptional regulator [Desulfovibrionaceae bacterium LT0009]
MPVLPKNLQDMALAIASSHKRSKKYNIDPNLTKAPESTRLTAKELEERIENQKTFYTVAKEQIDKLYTLLQGTGFCMALADKDGYVLYIIGDTDLVEHFKNRNCIPSYRWTEKDMGTCAIGLTLEDKKPIYIPGNEMYATLAQNISNSGAPVFDIDGSLLGVISLSGYTEKMHIHTLGLVCQAAEAVTSHLKEQRHSKELAIKNKYMSALLEAGTKGIVTVDPKGRIVQTNQKARCIFELDKNCIGKPFSSLTKTNFNFEQVLHKGKRFLAREISTNKGNGFLALDPVIMKNGEIVGAILTITEKKEMMQLAMEMTGSKAHFTFDAIVGTSPKLLEALEIAKIAAKNTASLLIYGETGTGKELFAQAIHNAGDRSDRPFVALNCGAIPSELLESELFGYEEGAFTGAQKGGRPGKLELADTGTLFLDEIGDMPFNMQVKLLRALQTGEIRRVGGIRTIPIDIRIISATNKDLKKEIEKECFRPDLFYRITTLSILIPPLRERRDDIPLLVDYFFKRFGNLDTRKCLAPNIYNLIVNYSWPGNVRQLESAIERAIHLADGKTIKAEHFGIEKNNADGTAIRNLTLDEMEKNIISESLQKHRGNMSSCAKSLGISRPTLYRKLEKYRISHQEK